MDWSNWKTWVLIGAALLALFAIYVFASPEAPLREETAVQTAARPGLRSPVQRARPAAPEGVEPVRLEMLEPDSGSYNSDRNLFRYVEPPPPTPVPTPKPVPPPDRDRDGIPDFQDNCPTVANPDQLDIDRNGIGAACQTTTEIPPPPPPPTPPPFPYKYIGSFGTPSRPIAAFSSGEEIVNVRLGETFGGRFILRNIGIESVDIGYVGFPPEVRKRIPVGTTP
jgi:hypothetical protein